MMAAVINTRTQTPVVTNLEVADTLFSRLQGLMGRKELSEGHGMLIKRSGNSIHTFFMKFNIDLIFINSSGSVKYLAKNVKPWRVVIAPLIKQTDCLEVPGGTIEKYNTLIGDTLRVEN